MPLSWNLGTLISWNPLGHSRPVTGLLYPYIKLLLILLQLWIIQFKFLFITCGASQKFKQVFIIPLLMFSSRLTQLVLYIVHSLVRHRIRSSGAQFQLSVNCWKSVTQDKSPNISSSRGVNIRIRNFLINLTVIEYRAHSLNNFQHKHNYLYWCTVNFGYIRFITHQRMHCYIIIV
jgi:hypothetical protein